MLPASKPIASQNESLQTPENYDAAADPYPHASVYFIIQHDHGWTNVAFFVVHEPRWTVGRTPGSAAAKHHGLDRREEESGADAGAGERLEGTAEQSFWAAPIHFS